MFQAGYNDAEIHSTAKVILLKMGEYFQIQVCTLCVDIYLLFAIIMWMLLDSICSIPTFRMIILTVMEIQRLQGRLEQTLKTTSVVGL